IEVVRQRLFAARRSDQLRSVVSQAALAHEMPRERAQRGTTSGGRRATDPTLVKRLEKSANAVGIERRDRDATGLGPVSCAEKLDELREVRVIGADGMWRCIAIEF